MVGRSYGRKSGGVWNLTPPRVKRDVKKGGGGGQVRNKKARKVGVQIVPEGFPVASIRKKLQKGGGGGVSWISKGKRPNLGPA